MADKLQQQNPGIAKQNLKQQNNQIDRPGEPDMEDPTGAVTRNLQGQQSGMNEAGQGDAMNLEANNRMRR